MSYAWLRSACDCVHLFVGRKSDGARGCGQSERKECENSLSHAGRRQEANLLMLVVCFFLASLDSGDRARRPDAIDCVRLWRWRWRRRRHRRLGLARPALLCTQAVNFAARFYSQRVSTESVMVCPLAHRLRATSRAARR